MLDGINKGPGAGQSVVTGGARPLSRRGAVVRDQAARKRRETAQAGRRDGADETTQGTRKVQSRSGSQDSANLGDRGNDARQQMQDFGEQPDGDQALAEALFGKQIEELTLEEQLLFDDILSQTLRKGGPRPRIISVPTASRAEIRKGTAPRNALPPGVDAAYVPGKNVIMVRQGLSPARQGAAIREEMGEWLGAQVSQRGLELAPGDVGARVAKVVRGADLKKSDFERRPDDKAVANFQGKRVRVNASAPSQLSKFGGPNPDRTKFIVVALAGGTAPSDAQIDALKERGVLVDDGNGKLMVDETAMTEEDHQTVLNEMENGSETSRYLEQLGFDPDEVIQSSFFEDIDLTSGQAGYIDSALGNGDGQVDNRELAEAAEKGLFRLSSDSNGIEFKTASMLGQQLIEGNGGGDDDTVGFDEMDIANTDWELDGWVAERGQKFFSFVLESANGGKLSKADFQDFYDQGVIELDEGKVRLDLTKLTKDQRNNLVRAAEPSSGVVRTHPSGGELLDEIYGAMLGVSENNYDTDYGGLSRANLATIDEVYGDGGNISRPDALVAAMDDGFIAFNADGVLQVTPENETNEVFAEVSFKTSYAAVVEVFDPEKGEWVEVARKDSGPASSEKIVVRVNRSGQKLPNVRVRNLNMDDDTIKNGDGSGRSQETPNASDNSTRVDFEYGDTGQGFNDVSVTFSEQPPAPSVVDDNTVRGEAQNLDAGVVSTATEDIPVEHRKLAVIETSRGTRSGTTGITEIQYQRKDGKWVTASRDTDQDGGFGPFQFPVIFDGRDGRPNIRAVYGKPGEEGTVYVEYRPVQNGDKLEYDMYSGKDSNFGRNVNDNIASVGVIKDGEYIEEKIEEGGQTSAGLTDILSTIFDPAGTIDANARTRVTVDALDPPSHYTGQEGTLINGDVILSTDAGDTEDFLNETNDIKHTRYEVQYKDETGKWKIGWARQGSEYSGTGDGVGLTEGAGFIPHVNGEPPTVRLVVIRDENARSDPFFYEGKEFSLQDGQEGNDEYVVSVDSGLDPAGTDVWAPFNTSIKINSTYVDASKPTDTPAQDDIPGPEDHPESDKPAPKEHLYSEDEAAQMAELENDFREGKINKTAYDAGVYEIAFGPAPSDPADRREYDAARDYADDAYNFAADPLSALGMSKAEFMETTGGIHNFHEQVVDEYNGEVSEATVPVPTPEGDTVIEEPDGTQGTFEFIKKGEAHVLKTVLRVSKPLANGKVFAPVIVIATPIFRDSDGKIRVLRGQNGVSQYQVIMRYALETEVNIPGSAFGRAFTMQASMNISTRKNSDGETERRLDKIAIGGAFVGALDVGAGLKSLYKWLTGRSRVQPPEVNVFNDDDDDDLDSPPPPAPVLDDFAGEDIQDVDVDQTVEFAKRASLELDKIDMSKADPVLKSQVARARQAIAQILNRADRRERGEFILDLDFAIPSRGLERELNTIFAGNPPMLPEQPATVAPPTNEAEFEDAPTQREQVQEALDKAEDYLSSATEYLNWLRGQPGGAELGPIVGTLRRDIRTLADQVDGLRSVLEQNPTGSDFIFADVEGSIQRVEFTINRANTYLQTQRDPFNDADLGDLEAEYDSYEVPPPGAFLGGGANPGGGASFLSLDPSVRQPPVVDTPSGDPVDLLLLEGGFYLPFVALNWWNSDAKVSPDNPDNEFRPGAGGLDIIPDSFTATAGVFYDTTMGRIKAPIDLSSLNPELGQALKPAKLIVRAPPVTVEGGIETGFVLNFTSVGRAPALDPARDEAGPPPV
ncbi:hypothetical protein [Yoonia sp. SS1-5]|uniref:Uncharacterized protein n=1 Tax=Yoonia rhodophyticola TaxID=3137370 RepID=A0AAN0MB05_9RHOB